MGVPHLTALFNQFQPLRMPRCERVTGVDGTQWLYIQRLFVMDGSRRSAHANAYFTGFGTSKRVVFFRHLLAQPPRLKSTLCRRTNEDHFKHRHVLKRMLTRVRCQPDRPGGTGLAQPASLVLTRAGVSRPTPAGPNDALAPVAVHDGVALWRAPLSAPGLRTHRVATNSRQTPPWLQTQAADLASALFPSLYEDNARPLTPDPYVRFYYSHLTCFRTAGAYSGFHLNP